MRSRASRLLVGAMAWIVLGIGAFLCFDLEQEIAARRAGSAAFDERAHTAAAVLSDVRVARQAAFGEGQDVAAWTPRIEGLVAAATTGIEELAASTTSVAVRTTLRDALSELARVTRLDESARAEATSEAGDLTGDLARTEGGRAAVAAARLLDRARIGERQEADAAVGSARRQQTLALLIAAVVSSLVVLLLALAPPHPVEVETGESALSRQDAEVDVPVVAEERHPEQTGTDAPAADETHALLSEAAEVCVALGRASDTGQLETALGRAAGLMRARGVIVWLHDAEGGPLRPALSAGYSPDAMARMPDIEADADNAVARAYRDGTLQAVAAAKAGTSSAIAIPLLTSGSCTGVLTAELAAGEEASPSVQALAGLFAAQCSNVFSRTRTAAQPADRHSEDSVASA